MSAGARRSGGRGARTTIAILLLALGLAGCGGSAPHGPNVEEAGAERAAHLQRLGGLASCLRENGVKVPAASIREPGIDLRRVDTAQPSFASAWDICRDQAGSGSFRPPPEMDRELNPALNR